MTYPTLPQFFRWHGDLIHDPREIRSFHADILSACTRWVLGTLPNNARNLAICMPPRHGKTLIARDLVAWGLGLFPDSEWIYTASSAMLAVAQTVAIKNTVSSDWYRQVFPHVGVLPGKGRQDYFKTARGGSVYGVGTGGTITGFGAGKKRAGFGGGIVIDDPLQAADAYSEAEREGCNRWYTQTLYSRRNSSKTPILLIMQRLHEQDLVGYLQEHESHLWHIVQIPVRDKQGHVLWPQTFSEDDAENMARLDPFAFSAQYMQSPTPPGGAMVKREWIQRYDSIPESCHTLIFTLDTALKTGQANDYSVAAAWLSDGIDVYLIDILRGKWEAPDLQTQVTAFLRKHKPRRPSKIRLRGVVIEDKSSGTGLIQALRRDQSLYDFPILPRQRSTDKVSRLNDVVPFIAAGRLHVPGDGACTWAFPYVQELCAFSPAMTHAHDDQVDVTIDALDILLQTGSMVRGMDLS